MLTKLRRLLTKLRRLGFRDIFIVLLERERIQVVGVGKSSSNIYFTNSGLPQGSMLSPLLFNLYFIDLASAVTSSIFQYGDDPVHVSYALYLSDSMKPLQLVNGHWEIGRLFLKAAVIVPCQSDGVGMLLGLPSALRARCLKVEPNDAQPTSNTFSIKLRVPVGVRPRDVTLGLTSCLHIINGDATPPDVRFRSPMSASQAGRSCVCLQLGGTSKWAGVLTYHPVTLLVSSYPADNTDPAFPQTSHVRLSPQQSLSS